MIGYIKDCFLIMHTVIISSNQYYMLKHGKEPEDFCMTYKIIGDSCLDLTDELKRIPDSR